MLTNVKGVLVLTAATLNTFVWFTPLILFTIVKLIVPVAGFRRLMTRWIMAMGENWISVNAFVFGRASGTRYELEGFDELRRDRWYVLLVNHQTWVDIIALQTAFNRRIPFLKFFVKQELIWFPLLGVAFWALDMPFMKRYSKAYLARHPEKKGTDLEQTRRACRKFNATPTSVINFVEGTRFSEEKRRRRESPYRYLLPPRAGGIAVTLSAMGDLFDALLDVTVHYPEGVPSFWDAMCGRFSAVHIEITQRRLEPWLLQGDYLDDRDYRRRFHRWLAELWQEKDAILHRLNQRSDGIEDPAARSQDRHAGPQEPRHRATEQQ